MVNKIPNIKTYIIKLYEIFCNKIKSISEMLLEAIRLILLLSHWKC